MDFLIVILAISFVSFIIFNIYKKEYLKLGLILGGIFIGLSLGIFCIRRSIYPLSEQYTISNLPPNTIDILLIETHNTLDDPEGDMVYLKTKEGEVYSYTLFEDQFVNLAEEPESNWHGSTLGMCDLGWRNILYVGKIIDKFAYEADRPISLALRCYILLDTNELKIWTNFSSVYDMVCIPILMIIGGIGGWYASIKWMKKKNMNPR